jgi:ubiquinone/menaquinone biosynthesis C-methylase UbiE
MPFLDRLLWRKGTCPWWLCFTFDNPLRRRLQNPDDILRGLVREGETVLDIGCGMGYLSLPLARMVGVKGRVICVDLQKEMLEAARKRAERAGLAEAMTFHQSTPESLGLSENADFAVAFWMVHEVSNKPKFLEEVRASLRAGGTFLIVEPKLHVTKTAFEETVVVAQAAGFKILSRPNVKISMAVLLTPA